MDKIERDEYMMVLDVLPLNSRGYPIIQAIGNTSNNYFLLFAKKEVVLELLQKVYVGSGKRKEIHHIQKKINYSDLTMESKVSLLILFKNHEIKEIILNELNNKIKDITIMDIFNKNYPEEKKRKKTFVLNYRIQKDIKSNIESKVYELKDEKIEITDSLSLKRLESIKKGKFVQH